MAGNSVDEEVDALAAEIRQLKAELKSQGLSSNDINKMVAEKVQRLQSLKSQLASDDPRKDEAFFARQKKEAEEAQKRKQEQTAQQNNALQEEENRAPQPLIQRKIFHLFAHVGTGPTFHYKPPATLNTKDCGFGGGEVPHPPVYVTEKWDGTTMQATAKHIFKRIDLQGRKRGTDPSQRYGLRLLAWRDEGKSEWCGLDFIEADERFLEALKPYLAKIAALEDGLCVYFEAVHTDINANFKQLPGFADIRVFDFSRSAGGSGKFLPFSETIELAKRYDLPLVGYEYRQKLSAEEIWSDLSAAQTRHYATAAALLEGFVVREAGEGGRIAKARVEQLAAAEAMAVKTEDRSSQASPAAPVAAGMTSFTSADRLTRNYLDEIGLLSYVPLVP